MEISNELLKLNETHPVIVSASRAADIPAFYPDWLMNRLKAGFSIWKNPFNGRPLKVCFDRTRVIVFWTKNPRPLFKYLPDLDALGLHYYFQYTLNDYEQEKGLEPGAGPLKKRIETFRELADLIGKDRVIWRFDPLIMLPNLTLRDLMARVFELSRELNGYTDKLVFSFIDVKGYRKVQNNLRELPELFDPDNPQSCEPSAAQKEEMAGCLQKIREYWQSRGRELTIASCCEDVDLKRFGIEPNRCIDAGLMMRLFPGDRILRHYLCTGRLPEPGDTLQGDLFEAPEALPQINFKKLKDKGQRQGCGCMVSKDIGAYNTCAHFCAYCYANSGTQAVRKNIKVHDPKAPGITF